MAVECLALSALLVLGQAAAPETAAPTGQDQLEAAAVGGVIETGASGEVVQSLPLLLVLQNQEDVQKVPKMLGLTGQAATQATQALAAEVTARGRVAAVFSPPAPFALLASRGQVQVNEAMGRVEVPVVYEPFGPASGEPSPLRIHYLVMALPASPLPVVLRLETILGQATEAPAGAPAMPPVVVQPPAAEEPAPAAAAPAGQAAPAGAAPAPAPAPAAAPPPPPPAPVFRGATGVVRRDRFGWYLVADRPVGPGSVNLRVVGPWVYRIGAYAGHRVSARGPVTMYGPDSGQIYVTDVTPLGPGPAPPPPAAGEVTLDGHVQNLPRGLRLVVPRPAPGPDAAYEVVGPPAERLPALVNQWVRVTGVVTPVPGADDRIAATSITPISAPAEAPPPAPGAAPAVRTITGRVVRTAAGFEILDDTPRGRVTYTAVGPRTNLLVGHVGRMATVTGVVTMTGPFTGTINVTDVRGPVGPPPGPRPPRPRP